MTRSVWCIVVGLAFAVHNGEEAFVAGTMLEMIQQRAPAFLRELYDGVTAAQLRASLLVLSLLGAIVAAIARRSIDRRPAAFAIMVFAAVLGFNAVVHVALTIASGAYVPGLVTALFITLPVAVLLLRQARREQWVTAPAFWAIVPAALIVHGPGLWTFLLVSRMI